MKISTFGYLMKEGFRGIFLHGFMSFAAVCVTVACLLIVGFFSCLSYNLNLMVNDLNKTNEVMVYIDDQLEDHEARSVHSSISRIENVQSAVFISKEEALQNFAAKQDNPEDFVMDPDTFEHRCSVTLIDNRKLDQTRKALEAVPGVTEVRVADKIAKAFVAMQDILSIFTVVVLIGLLIVSLLIISNTVKLAMHDRRDEIAIMKVVGATNGFIRLPFVVEGFFLGITGAAFAFGLMWVVYDVLAARLAEVDALSSMLKIAPFTTDLLWPMVALFAGAGVFVGIVGSWTSIRKFMDV